MDIDRRVLIAARALAGLSQAELAAMAGMHLNALQRIEAGGAMRASTAERLLAAFGQQGIELLASPDGSYVGVRRDARRMGETSAGPFRAPRPRARRASPRA